MVNRDNEIVKLYCQGGLTICEIATKLQYRDTRSIYRAIERYCKGNNALRTELSTKHNNSMISKYGVPSGSSQILRSSEPDVSTLVVLLDEDGKPMPTLNQNSRTQRPSPTPSAQRHSSNPTEVSSFGALMRRAHPKCSVLDSY